MALPQEVEDGTYDWSLGQDAYKYPDKIRANQYAKGINITTKKTNASPRPGFHQQKLTFDVKSIDGRTIEDLWTSGKFQAGISYERNKDKYIITVVGGLIYRINVTSKHIVLLSEDMRVDQYASKINWSYASNKIVVFDFPNYPLIIDGDTIYRADPLKNEVPVSTIGAYNQNRLFIANAGVEFTAGDPVGSKLTPDAPITFEEVFTPSSPFINQVFSLPVEAAIYPILAMGFIQALDTSTGIGQMFIATKKKVYTYQVQQPRAQWESTPAFGSLLLANEGIAGPRAFTNVNSDFLFMSAEGKIHALSSARNDAKRWSNIPISREVENFLTFNDPELSQYCVMGYFDNRIYITANPYRVNALTRDGQNITDYAHGGMVVLELDNLASFLSDGTPTWAGLWTGINAMEIIDVGGRLFFLSKDGRGRSGTNALYVLDEDTNYDTIADRKRPVRSVIYTRQYSFTGDNTNGEFIKKKEQTVALHLQSIKGNLKLTIDRLPTHSANWLSYATWEHNAPVSTEDFPEDKFADGYAPHELLELIFGDAEDGKCNPITDDLYDTWRGIQYRLTFEGEGWTLENFKVKAQIKQIAEKVEPEMCGLLPAIPLPLVRDTDWFIPEETSCQPRL